MRLPLCLLRLYVKIEFKPYTAVEIWELLKEHYNINEYFLTAVARAAHEDIDVAFSLADRISALGNITPVQFLKLMEKLKL